jgi:sarcosine oxidase
VRLRYDAEVAVVGLGAWGSNALLHLAQRGVRTMGIERFTPGHSMGASGGGSRMFRTVCLEHPSLVPLAQRSLQLWQELADKAGEPLIDASGGMLIGSPDGYIVSGTLRAAREHSLNVETWDSARLTAEFPAHGAVPDHHIGVMERGAGLVRPEAAIRVAVRLAEAAGARVYADTKVTGIDLVDGGVVITTPARKFGVEQVVVATGGWLAALVDGLPLETIRMPQTWFKPGADAERFARSRLPVFMRELDVGMVIWGHGAEDNGPYAGQVKLGLEDPGGRFPVIDPETFDRSVHSDDWTMLAKRLVDAVPGLDPEPSSVSVCMYTRTPDNQFLLGRPRCDPRLVIAGGCNCHGFKHATGLGEAVADIVLAKSTSCPLEFLDPNRFL